MVFSAINLHIHAQITASPEIILQQQVSQQNIMHLQT